MSNENFGARTPLVENLQTVTSLDHPPGAEKIALYENITQTVEKAGKVLALVSIVLGASAAESQTNDDIIKQEYQRIQTCWEGGQNLDEISQSLHTIIERFHSQSALLLELKSSDTSNTREFREQLVDRAKEEELNISKEWKDIVIPLVELSQVCREALGDVVSLSDEIAVYATGLEPFAHMGSTIKEITVTLENIQEEIIDIRAQK